MHLEDAPAGAAEAVSAEAEHGGLLGVALQIESRAPSNPLRTHKEEKKIEEGRNTEGEGGRGDGGKKGGNGPRLGGGASVGRAARRLRR